MKNLASMAVIGLIFTMGLASMAAFFFEPAAVEPVQQTKQPQSAPSGAGGANDSYLKLIEAVSGSTIKRDSEARRKAEQAALEAVLTVDIKRALGGASARAVSARETAWSPTPALRISDIVIDALGGAMIVGEAPEGAAIEAFSETSSAVASADWEGAFRLKLPPNTVGQRSRRFDVTATDTRDGRLLASATVYLAAAPPREPEPPIRVVDKTQEAASAEAESEAADTRSQAPETVETATISAEKPQSPPKNTTLTPRAPVDKTTPPNLEVRKPPREAAQRSVTIGDAQEVSAWELAAGLSKSSDKGAGERLSIDRVGYDAKGRAVIAGRGRPQARARVMLNGETVSDLVIGADGVWRASLPRGAKPGLYNLRVESLNAGGDVADAAETPFEQAQPGELLIREGAVVVQPGNNLWKIASHVYGDGYRYHVIYRSNKEQIRDPDLIYPGQVLKLPDLTEFDKKAD